MSDGLGNIKVIITRLEIKTEKEIALVDIQQQDSPIFPLKLLLPNRSVDMAQIDNKRFLARGLYGHRKRVNNMWIKRYLCNCKILEVASYSNLNNYMGSAVRDIRTPLVDSN